MERRHGPQPQRRLVACGLNLRKRLSYLRRAVGIVELVPPTVALDASAATHCINV